MATAITTVTKTASVVKNTKGSEKKWSEILSMNRRHDLQLPLSIEKYNHEFKRTFNIYQRQQNQTERSWAHKHETWYQDDFIFRDHLLKQLKPITRRFRHINSLALQENNEQEDDADFLIEKENLPTKKDLPPLKKPINSIKNGNSQAVRRKTFVLSKLVCPKVLHECKPRLDSFRHTEFLDVAQRFLKHKPENLGKASNSIDKQKQQRQYLKTLIDNEQERTRLAAIQFGKQLENEKNKQNQYDDDFDDDDYNDDY